MKKLLVVLTLILSGVLGAQVTTVPNVPKKEVAQDHLYVSKPYDSIVNFLGEDYHKYIGQELYLLPKPESLREYGYRDFLIDFTKVNSVKRNIYKEGDNFSTRYEELVGKYFEVLDIYNHPNYDSLNYKSTDYLYSELKFFKLKEKASGDILYYKYDTRFEHKFPFLVVGYFDKQREKYIGVNLTLNGRNWMDGNPLSDMNTGLKVSYGEDVQWTCVDVSVEERFYTLSMILENNKGERVPFTVKRFEAEKLKPVYTFKKRIDEIKRDNQIRIKEDMVLSTLNQVLHYTKAGTSGEFFYDFEKTHPIKSDSLINRSFKVSEINRNNTTSTLVLVDINSNDTIYYKHKENYYFPYDTHFTSDTFDYDNPIYLDSKISRDVDDFTGEVKIGSPLLDKVRVVKIINKGISEYYLILRTSGSTLNVSKKGVIILFEDGSKLQKPELKVNASSSSGYGWEYSAYLKLTQNDIEILKKKNISKFRLYIYDDTVNVEKSKEIKAYMKYIQKVK